MGAATEMKLYQKSLEQFYSTAGVKAIVQKQAAKEGLEANGRQERSGMGEQGKETRFMRQQLSREHWTSELELKGDTSQLLRELHNVRTPAQNFRLADNACLLAASKRMCPRTSPRRPRRVEL